MSEIRIVGLAERPALVPVVGIWLWEEWAKRKGRTLEQVIARLASYRATTGPEQTFVLLEGATPVATASLVHHDLDPRPELTPWLAGVYVDPPFRGRGHAARLVRAVEERRRPVECAGSGCTPSTPRGCMPAWAGSPMVRRSITAMPSP